MKQLILIFLMIFTAICSPIKPKTLANLNSFGTVLLDTGKADLTINDSGAAILFESGKLWITATNHSVQVLFNEGIATVAGIAFIETDSVGTRLRTISGFLEIVETGGFPGEILPQGFERRLYRTGLHDSRRLILEDFQQQFCDTFPGTVAFGCPALIDTTENITIATDDTLLTKVVVIIHPIAEESTQFEQLPGLIQAELIRREPTAQITAVSEINYRQHWEYTSNQSLHYIIIDGAIPRKMPNEQNNHLQVSFFDSKSKTERHFRLPFSGKMSADEMAKAIQEIALRLLECIKEVTAEPTELP